MLRARYMLLLCLLFPSPSFAQDRGSGGGKLEKYQRRSAQRFDLISYLTDQKRIRAEQDAKWGYVKKGLPFELDMVLTYFDFKGDVERGAVIGSNREKGGRVQFFLNGLFTDSDKRRLINIDIGFEGFYRTGKFDALDTPTQSDWETTQMGGGLLLRPFGRSSQDTGFFFKGGYATITERGLWSTTLTEQKLAAPYWGGEAKLYLLPILGLRGEYVSSSGKAESTLGGTWTQSRSTVGAFVELFVFSIEANLFETHYLLKPTGGGAETKDSHKGAALIGSLYF